MPRADKSEETNQHMKKRNLFAIVFIIATLLLSVGGMIRKNQDDSAMKQVNQFTNSISNASDERAELLDDYHLNKIPGAQDNNTSQDDSSFIRGTVIEKYDNYIVMENTRNDCLTYYKVLVPTELKSELNNIDVDSCVDVKGTVTSEQKNETIVYIIMQADDISIP